MQILLFFMQGIPETAGIVACCLALAKVKLRWRVILIVAIALTVVIYLVRNLPFTFGVHSLAAILLCALFIAKATKVPPSTSFLVSFVGFAMLVILEVVMYELIGKLFNTDIKQLISNDYTLMLIGLPQAVIMIAIAPLITKYRKPLEGMWRI